VRIALAVVVGRAVRWLTRLRGGGSAMPGNAALLIAPQFLEHAFQTVTDGIIFVSGSNGKSTTTNMLARILRAHGLDVFTNPSAVHADVAVLEVDEAYSVGLSARLAPTTTLIVNVQVDQLNRFYEPARVAQMLATLVHSTKANVILNADDDSLREVGTRFASTKNVSWFGVEPALLASAPHGLANVIQQDDSKRVARPVVGSEVVAHSERSARIRIGKESSEFPLPARGLHYAVDAAGAIGAARVVLGRRFNDDSARQGLAAMQTIYGRGEVITVNGEDIEIIMMKNPPSLQMNLDALPGKPEQLLVAVDEGTPDPSWIYGIDLSNLGDADIITGTKAWQIATRWAYEGLEVRRVEPDPDKAVAWFLALPRPTSGVKVMLVNYELMMSIRKHLGFLELEGGNQ
jgi:lipid II isoglutaminyl synthase (glutamine-hydrolysing)